MATTRSGMSSRNTSVETRCPACGMERDEWPDVGYSKDGQLYCCQGCAEGTGCTCEALE